MKLQFWVHGLPKAQPRAKATTIGGRHARMYTPPVANQWKSDIATIFRQEYPNVDPLQCAVSMLIHFYLPRPKGHFGTGKNAGKLKESAPKFHTTKPDVDNLGKAVLDALKGHAWRDDSQVCSVWKNKWYADDNGRVGALIVIDTME